MRYKVGDTVEFVINKKVKRGKIRSAFYGQVEDFGYLTNIYSIKTRSGTIYADIEHSMIAGKILNY